MTHQDILNEIGNSLDIALTFDDNNQCFLLLDEHLMVSVRSVEEAWILYGMLGNFEENEQPEGTAQALLALNLQLAESGQGGIVQEASSKVTMLVLRVATAGIDGDRMQDILSSFVDVLDKVRTAFVALQKPLTERLSLSNFTAGPGIFDRA